MPRLELYRHTGMPHCGSGRASSVILGMLLGRVIHQHPTRTPWLWHNRLLFLDTPSQELGMCLWQQVEEVALGSDDGEPKDVVVSTGYSGALLSLLHTQGENSKPGAELVALAPL